MKWILVLIGFSLGMAAMAIEGTSAINLKGKTIDYGSPDDVSFYCVDGVEYVTFDTGAFVHLNKRGSVVGCRLGDK